MEIKNDLIKKDISCIMNILESNGYEAYLVGGCVRDTLLGLEPNDWDITTNAIPDEVESLLSKNGIRTIPTGKKYGTITALIQSDEELVNCYEITTFRHDFDYLDGRRPDKVEYGNSIYEDLERRDFTVNAMAYGKNGLIDPFNGQLDLKNKCIRCVGDPCTRFNEDGLRILRAIRFASKLDFYIEKETSDALYKCMPNLNNVSKERILSEILEILNSSYAWVTIPMDINCSRCIAYILEIDISDVVRKTMLDKSIISLRDYIDNSYKLYSILSSFKNNYEIEKWIVKYKCSNSMKREIMTYYNLDLKYKNCHISKTHVKKMLSEYPEHIVIKYLKNSHPTLSNDIITAALKEPHLLRNLCVNGNDIINNFNFDKKRMANILQKCLDEVIEHPLNNRKEFLLDLIKMTMEEN